MPRRRRHQEVEMPEWTRETPWYKEEQPHYDPLRVPVPVRREPNRTPHYLYAQAEIEEPWYTSERNQSTERGNKSTEKDWDERLLERLASHLTDMFHLHGPHFDVDTTITNWLDSNRDFSRAILLGLLSEEKVRDAFDRLPSSMVNSAVHLIFS